MDTVLLLSIFPIICITFNIVSIIWIIYQCAYFVENPKFHKHQAFKIRGRNIFLMTAVVMILNIIFRPILVSISLLDLISINSGFWRAVMDVVQMSLYAIVEFRCWITYFNLNSSSALVDKQWEKYLDQRSETTQSTNDCFRYCYSVLGRPAYVGAFFALHGILCVLVCGFVEEYQSFDPHRIICHFFMANALMFIIFTHRMYWQYLRVKHTYSHDMLAINKELNLTTIIMTLTALCDSTLGFFFHENMFVVHLPYIVYQTLLIAFLCVIIFYLPQRTITRLLLIENTIQVQAGAKALSLQHVFGDTDLYYSFIRFAVQEWSAENLLFVTHWMQIQKIIVDSGVDIKVNEKYTCGCGPQCQLLNLSSDVLLYGNNLLEATRGIYDKFVKTNDILQINISHESREELNTFYAKYPDIQRIFSSQQKSIEIQDRATVVVVDGENAKNNDDEMMVKYKLFMEQLQASNLDKDIIQQMVDAYAGTMKDCWENTCDSFSRFQSTLNYKINSSYFNLQDAKK